MLGLVGLGFPRFGPGGLVWVWDLMFDLIALRWWASRFVLISFDTCSCVVLFWWLFIVLVMRSSGTVV